MSQTAIYGAIFGLVGGIGLFLYGINLMSKGLQRAAGERLKFVLGKLTSNRIIGVCLGAAVTIMVQSSTAVTVMVVGFVNAGVMSLLQGISVIIGANIGTTIVAQIISFKITAFALPAVGLGALVYLFTKNSSPIHYVGQAILGVGLLLIGMSTMTAAFEPVKDSTALAELFVTFSKYPILGVLAGSIATVIMQSSAATIGITIALATTGLIDYQGAIALVLGDNIGTTTTANIAAIGSSKAARQAAFGHFLFNFTGVVLMLVFLKPFSAFVDLITTGDPMLLVDGQRPYMARHVANVHTIFNVLSALVILPLLNPLVRICEFCIKGSLNEQAYKLTYLSDEMISTPEIALSQLNAEVVRMSNVAYGMLEHMGRAVIALDYSRADKISKDEKTLDAFQDELLRFIDKLATSSISRRSASNIIRMRQFVQSMEEMGDNAKRMMKSTMKMFNSEYHFSEAATIELNRIFSVLTTFASNVFDGLSSSTRPSHQLLSLRDEISNMSKQFRSNHVTRLHNNQCSAEAGLYYADMLGYLERMGSNIFAIAQLIVADDDKPA
ncbi:Na/Pi cotransporter family protein [Deferribacterales bacterium RsTz2092]